ncbi:MAG: hypothetical protein K9N11_02405 [Lentisphaeria bacterium]|nr:hypothetical protein [Lentisphaeria bacterium]
MMYLLFNNQRIYGLFKLVSLVRYRVRTTSIFILLISLSQPGYASEFPNDFFGVKWGASPSQARVILSNRGLKLDSDYHLSTIYVLYYQTNLYDYNCELSLSFDNNKFWHGEVTYGGLTKYKYNTETLKIISQKYLALLTKKYGKPKKLAETEDSYEYIWVPKNKYYTIIVSIVFQSDELVIAYNAQLQKPSEEELMDGLF